MMTTIAAQTWKSSSFTVERHESEPGTTSFRLSGPFTARDMYTSLSPSAVRSIFDFTLGSDEPQVHRFDLTQVPYMDSMGLGMLVRHYVHCQAKGIRLIVTGVNPRVLSLFRIANVEKLLGATAAI